ncbi:unnamed protein product [Thlaspi arvense]|uniref:Uncharacterized protein n=1 Tax=Thlaspi arvense TaxID=13288 RepID=A0AAU9SDK3_THLAR|nr:unnamed protein product [Thlaspi arvense]
MTQSLLIERLTDKEPSDELRQVTCDEENATVTFPQEPEATEYATEKIVRSLSLKSSSAGLETYTMVWSLRPFVEGEIMNRAWKWIY